VAGTLAVATISTAFFFVVYAPVVIEPAVDVEIRPGETAGEVASDLEATGVVRSARILLLLARLDDLDRQFRHGRHRFSGAMTPQAVLAELVRTPLQDMLNVTVPEGMDSFEIAGLLQQQGIVSAEDYRSAVCDPSLAVNIPLPDGADCLEGYLFPDTYALTPGTGAREFASMQLARFREVTASLFDEAASQFPGALSPHAADLDSAPANATEAERHAELLWRAVTLASIIEKETGVPDERPLIASVFHNRLRRGMRLQADPTVIYGLRVAGVPWERAVLHEYVRTPGPYNTYMIDGLPPGPIGNPGLAALRAALQPTASKYLYFVSNGDGSHQFSTTLVQHNQAVAELRGRTVSVGTP
jgi:UPF0755 protein